MMITPSQTRPAAGFTLIELMLVVGIISIMTAMAIGLTTDWRRRSVFDTVAREIYNGLNLARASAIKRGSRVKLSFVDTPGNALYVFADADNDNEYDAGETLIYTFPDDDEDDWPRLASAINANIDPVILAANGNDRVLIFDAYGFHVDINGEPIGGTITVQDVLSGTNHFVDVTIAGALRVR